MAFELNELALAYELRQEDCSWKRIAQGLGCDPDALKQAVNNLVRNGISTNPEGERGRGAKREFSLEVLRQIPEARKRHTWRQIANSLGVEPRKLLDCYRRTKARGLI